MRDDLLPLRLDRRFVDQVQRTPDRVALTCGERAMTYAELDACSARAAAGLRASGIGPGALVGLHVERSLDWAVAVLGILRAQATVLPLPPNYPPARLSAILAESGARAVIYTLATPIGSERVPLPLDLDALCATAPASSAISQVDDGDLDQPAFVLCSSGSTGRPKMIVRSHRSFFHRLSWTWRTHPFAPGEVGCHKAHSTTTHGIYELFEPLLAGAPTVVVPDEQARDLEGFWELVRSRGVTRLLMVPSAMQASLDLPRFTPPALKVLVLMGEHLPARLAQRICNAFAPATRLYSIYGSTEASSTLVCDLRQVAGADRDLPLGQPISPSIGAHVLGANMQPVAPGQVGRLYVSGPALFDGYLGQPDLTAKVLLRDPRGATPLYDTRDDVRRLEDGNIIFVGRADDTVKIRGWRVELAEVQRAIEACPGVAQAAVVADDEREADAALLGFYTPRSVAVEAVFRTLRDRLPPYMLPAALIGLDAFPLTERSKLDRKRLLADYRARQATRDEPARFSEFEQRVAAVWERTLGHRRFDRDSSFFEVGGTSLTAAVLMHRLREAFALPREQLPEQFAYRHPTVAAMAQRLAAPSSETALGVSGGSAVLVDMRRRSDEAAPPLFCVASAGGTVGAYRKLAAALRHEGGVVGIRDPYVTGERDPTQSFDRWVDLYVEAVRSRQPDGPYFIAAYSSAGAFGLELARRLRAQGAEVALLALIDPLGIEGDRCWRYGRWVLRSTHSRNWVRQATRLTGRLRRPVAPLLRALANRRAAGSFALSPQQFQQLAAETVAARGHLMALAALTELNSGLPVDLSDAEIPAAPEDSTLRALQARMVAALPGIDAETIERIAIQYAVQLRAQAAYTIAPYDGPAMLVEPVSLYAGLLESQLRPYFPRLRVVRLALGTPDPRTERIAKRFGTLAPHFLCMRDDTFAASLARELDGALRQAQALTSAALQPPVTRSNRRELPA
jgi:amino acid adenylation domain-containing protein